MAGIGDSKQQGIVVGTPLGRTWRIVVVPLGLVKVDGVSRVIGFSERKVKSPCPAASVGLVVAGLGDLPRVVMLGEAARSG